MNTRAAWALLLWLAAEPLAAYQLLDAKWPGGEVTLQLNFNDAPAGHHWGTAMGLATEAWAERVAGLAINTRNSGAYHPCDGYRKGKRSERRSNAVAFSHHVCNAEFGRNTLAATLIIAKHGQIREADIVFNRRYRWDLFQGYRYGRVDFYRVALHELGHFIGLGHEHRRYSIMAPALGRLDRPTRDDLAGARALYSGGQFAAKPRRQNPASARQTLQQRPGGEPPAPEVAAGPLPPKPPAPPVPPVPPVSPAPAPQQAQAEQAQVAARVLALGPNLIQVEGVRVASGVYRVLLRWRAEQGHWLMERFEAL